MILCMHLDNLTISILIHAYAVVVNPSGKWILSVILVEQMLVVDFAVLFLVLSFFSEEGETSLIPCRDRNINDS